MAAIPETMRNLLGWKGATAKTKESCTKLFGRPIAPNLADLSSQTSMKFAAHAYELLGIPMTKRGGNLDDDSNAGASGPALEKEIETDLKAQLPGIDRDRDWRINREGTVVQFAQFSHLSVLQAILEKNPAIRATYAGDYQIKTDVWVSLPNELDDDPRFLHAAIASKWTIRSDRVQNVRHEFAMLIRNRRGRSPHLVLVTAEPQPTRVLSIARGTGEIDAVYHLLFDQLDSAVSELCSHPKAYPKQRQAWEEMVDQKRLLPYTRLYEDLTLS